MGGEVEREYMYIDIREQELISYQSGRLNRSGTLVVIAEQHKIERERRLYVVTERSRRRWPRGHRKSPVYSRGTREMTV